MSSECDEKIYCVYCRKNEGWGRLGVSFSLMVLNVVFWHNVIFVWLIQVQTTEINLMVRVLERLYSRLVSFGRSVLEVVVPPNESSLPPAADEFKHLLDEASLNMVLTIAECCCQERQLPSLKLQTADCLTYVRQQLITNVYSKPTARWVFLIIPVTCPMILAVSLNQCKS